MAISSVMCKLLVDRAISKNKDSGEHLQRELAIIRTLTIDSVVSILLHLLALVNSIRSDNDAAI